MSYIKSIVLYAIFYFAIAFVWRLYELKTIGYVHPDPFDSLIALILSLSLVANVFLYQLLTKGNNKKDKKQQDKGVKQ